MTDMVDPREFDRIHTELTVVGNMMGECVNEFINMKISRKTFDERMSIYADRIETARRDEDRLLAAFGEIIQKIQEHTEPSTPTKQKNKKKK